MQYFTNNFPQIKFTSRTSVRDILTIPSVVPIKRTNQISIGNSMACRDIWHKYHEWYFKIVIRNRQFWNITSGIYAKYHAHIILLLVYTATRKRFVIFTCRYFKWSWNTTALSQSNCRNFSCGSIIMFNCDNVAKKQNSLLFFFTKTKICIFCIKIQWHLNRTVLQWRVSGEKSRLEKWNCLKYFNKKKTTCQGYKKSFFLS